MKYLFIILILFSCKKGIHITKKDYSDGGYDSFHSAHSEKVIEKKDKITPKITKIKEKQKKKNLRILKYNSKQAKKEKKERERVPYDFH